ncbi:DUF502 domain-containing protein [Thermodesulfobacteriota bacterium]
MKRIIQHIKRYIIRGLLSIIPLALTIFAISLLYNAIDQRMVRVVDGFMTISFPGLGIIIVLFTLYILGIIASNIVGIGIFSLIEKITSRIPLIGTTYKIGRQIGKALSLPEKSVFKKAVLVEYLREGTWTIGFMTGTVIDKKNNDEIFLKVFVPTPPNPTSGTMVIVRKSRTRDPGWTIDEALKTILSGGIIGPEEIK